MVNKYFQVDPLKSTSREKEKTEFLERTSNFMLKLFGKTKEEVYAASKAFKDNPDGLRNYILIVKNWDRVAKYELKDTATSMAVCSAIFSIEGICSEIEPRKPNKKKEKKRPSIKAYQLYYFLSRFLSRDDKILLLNSFVFSRKTYKEPIPHTTKRHLMYRATLSTCDYNTIEGDAIEYCMAESSLGNISCNCCNWLRSQDEKVIDRYLVGLSKRLYTMRCAVVHDGIAPAFCHTENKPPECASWGMTVVDMYLGGKKNTSRYFVSYDSAISRIQFEEMFKRALWNSFCAGFPKKMNIKKR